MLEEVKHSTDNIFRKSIEKLYKAHMSNYEYKTYLEETYIDHAQICPAYLMKDKFTQAEKEMIKED